MKHYEFKITCGNEVRFMDTYASNEEVARKRIVKDFRNLWYLDDNVEVKTELVNF